MESIKICFYKSTFTNSVLKKSLMFVLAHSWVFLLSSLLTCSNRGNTVIKPGNDLPLPDITIHDYYNKKTHYELK